MEQPAKETQTSYEDCDNIVDEIWPQKWTGKSEPTSFLYSLYFEM